jgi:hypothetical protein
VIPVELHDIKMGAEPNHEPNGTPHAQPYNATESVTGIASSEVKSGALR